MSTRADLLVSSRITGGSSAGAPDSGPGLVVPLLEESGLELNVLTPSVQSRGAGTCLWVHEEALARIQRFRGSVYEEQGTLPVDAVRMGRRYTLSCDSQNFHLLLTERTGALVASLRFRFYRPGTTASGLKLFESVRRMPPAQGVLYTSTINSAIAEARARGLWVVEVSGLAVARPYWNCEALRLLSLAALAMIRSMTPALVFALIPSSPHGDLVFEGFDQQVYGLGHLDSSLLSGELLGMVEQLQKYLLLTHPHLATCQPSDGDETLPPLFFQQTGSRPGVGTYR